MGAWMFAQSASRFAVAITLARAAIVDSESGADRNVFTAASEKARRARASGIATQISGRSRNGDSARNTGPSIHGAFKYIW